MPWLALAAALAAPAMVCAQEAPSGFDRILSDPAYLPSRGQFYSVTGLDYESDNATTLAPSGSATGSGRDKKEIFHQTFVYAVTSALYVNVEGEYAWSQINEQPVGGAGRAYSANGFEDPNLGLTYRLLSQPAYPLILDLSAVYSPNVVGARASDVAGGGTEARGGDAWKVQIAAAHATHLFTVRAYAAFERLGQATETDDQGIASIRSAYWRPDLGVASQIRFTDRFSLNVGGEYNFAESDTLSVRSPLVPGAEHLGGFGDLTAALNYHFVPNRIVGSLSYTHTFYEPDNVSFAAAPADNYSARHSEDTVGVWLQYVF
jgi:hypothetical protein